MFWKRRSSASRPSEPAEPSDEADPFEAARQWMVRTQLESRGIADPEILQAFRRVPRHAFVGDSGLIDEAYADRALPAGEGQTMSQPYVVALMTVAGRPPGDSGYRGARVLEIGTGSGYAAAILAELGADVTSIERHAALSESAGARLRAAGYADVELVVGDGTQGWPGRAPYASILVTAGGPQVPRPLVDQLDREGGRLVVPIGSRDHQVLTLVERHGDELTRRELEGVVFVPLIGTFGVRG